LLIDTFIFASGLLASPEITLPALNGSKEAPWHGQTNFLPAFKYSTVQP
jgi:hypothetical protein